MIASQSAYPDTLEIKPLARPATGAVSVPGSKSITNRALVLAALSDPSKGSELRGVLRSEDTEVMVEALRALGFRLHVDWDKSTIHVRRGPSASPIPASSADLFVANSGTTMRFLTAMVALGHGTYHLDGVTRMRERPIDDLLSALDQLGASCRCEREQGFPPVAIASKGLRGGKISVRGDVSSQFLSGLLMAAPLANNDVTIDVQGELVSKPYVAMTANMMEEFGASVETDSMTHFHVSKLPWYRGVEYEIEPDASAASYFFAAAAVAGGHVTVLGIPEDSLQGDVSFVDALEEMGCRVDSCSSGITVHGRSLRGIEVDMNDISDTVMTLAAVACFAKGPTTIRNVAHIRHKETDRLTALATELRRIGAEVTEFADGLTIEPRPLHGAMIDTYNDHRMAMSMALVGLKVPGIVIKNPACVAKTYPGFFEDLEQLREPS
jgi:3-phosphoshikimate 1-carboxyvinyltransferase